MAPAIGSDLGDTAQEAFNTITRLVISSIVTDGVNHQLRVTGVGCGGVISRELGRHLGEQTARILKVSLQDIKVAVSHKQCQGLFIWNWSQHQHHQSVDEIWAESSHLPSV